MADADVETRIRDLKKRVEREPRSRFFVPLAEEYRKAGRLPDAIRALEEGLTSHPGYVAARVALARALLETGRIEESMEAFSKVLIDDPSNLVAAKALGDIHLSRGEPMEALKRYLRFRAVSGDRRLDEVIAKLREETAAGSDAPVAPAPAPVGAAASALRPAGANRAVGSSPLAPRQPSPASRSLAGVAAPSGDRSVRHHVGSLGHVAEGGTRYDRTGARRADVVAGREPRGDFGRRPDRGESPVRRIRLPEANWPFEPGRGDDGKPAAEARPPPPIAVVPPRTAAGRAAARSPSSTSSRDTTRRQSALRTSSSLRFRGTRGCAVCGTKPRTAWPVPAPAQPRRKLPPAVADPGRERRLAKIHLLNQWLDAVSEKSRE